MATASLPESAPPAAAAAPPTEDAGGSKPSFPTKKPLARKQHPITPVKTTRIRAAFKDAKARELKALGRLLRQAKPESKEAARHAEKIQIFKSITAEDVLASLSDLDFEKKHQATPAKASALKKLLSNRAVAEAIERYDVKEQKQVKYQKIQEKIAAKTVPCGMLGCSALFVSEAARDAHRAKRHRREAGATGDAALDKALGLNKTLNRAGQRERQRIRELQAREKLKQENPAGDRTESLKRGRPQETAAADDEAAVHPSWEAARLKKAKLDQKSFEGAKVTFSDDDEEESEKPQATKTTPAAAAPTPVKSDEPPRKASEKKKQQDELHPSWQIANKRRVKEGDFAGTKVAFSDEED